MALASAVISTDTLIEPLAGEAIVVFRQKALGDLHLAFEPNVVKTNVSLCCANWVKGPTTDG